MIIDENYLNHKFIIYEDDFIKYKCENCGVIVFAGTAFENNLGEIYISNLWKCWNPGKVSMYGKLRLSCNEMIIKSIIE